MPSVPGDVAHGVDLHIDEKSPESRRQDPDTVGAEFRVADYTNGLGGFEDINQTPGQATIGQVRSSELVALANWNAAD